MCRSTHSLTSALDGGEWSASRPGRFTSRERAPGTHWIGGWVGPRAVLDAVVKRKIPSTRRESNPRTLIVQPVKGSISVPVSLNGNLWGSCHMALHIHNVCPQMKMNGQVRFTFGRFTYRKKTPVPI